MSDWNSKQYMHYANERAQPSHDLIASLGTIEPQRILDLGCGPGNSTPFLKKRFPMSEIIGIDSSEDMLCSAATAHPDICFEKCVVSEGLTQDLGKFDLIFSNACIHWVEDQNALMQSVIERLTAGGTLAVQIR